METSKYARDSTLGTKYLDKNTPIHLYAPIRTYMQL